jgi:hypothetical protein
VRPGLRLSVAAAFRGLPAGRMPAGRGIAPLADVPGLRRQKCSTNCGCSGPTWWCRTATCRAIFGTSNTCCGLAHGRPVLKLSRRVQVGRHRLGPGWLR